MPNEGIDFIEKQGWYYNPNIKETTYNSSNRMFYFIIFTHMRYIFVHIFKFTIDGW